jgi:hypothetical protein
MDGFYITDWENVKLRILYPPTLFSVNWEKTTVIQCQWQNPLGHLLEHHCYPGAYFGNNCFKIITVITSFLWKYHTIHKFANFSHHNRALQDPMSDVSAITASTKSALLQCLECCSGLHMWHCYYPQLYSLSCDLHWNVLVCSEVGILFFWKLPI